MILGVNLWVIGVIAIGFLGNLRDLRLITGYFMGFWVGFMDVAPPQGDSWVFGYLWGFL